MKITVCKNAGFCYGVSRAIGLLEKLMSEGKKVCTLGPLLHNPAFLLELGRRGVITAGAVSEVPGGYCLLTRSHGISKQTAEELENSGVEWYDGTCPSVARIHRLVAGLPPSGSVLLIAGDVSHPEVGATLSYSACPAYVFSDSRELRGLLEKGVADGLKRVYVCAQTTFLLSEWEKCSEIIKKRCTNAVFFDTICAITRLRQTEAERIAADSDLMVVIGGRNSSNTAKLFEACSALTNAVWVESPDEFDPGITDGHARIGITAGASTPVKNIMEVVHKMDEKNETVAAAAAAEAEKTETVKPEIADSGAEQPEPAQTETAQAEAVQTETAQSEAENAGETQPEAAEPEAEKPAEAQAEAEKPAEAQPEAEKPAETQPEAEGEEEFNYEDALLASFDRLNKTDTVKGVVTAIHPGEVEVDIGRKHAGYIPLNELTDDPNAKIADLVKVGDVLTLMVLKTNDADGTVMMSKKRVDANLNMQKLEAACESGEVLEGTVHEIVKGGALISYEGTRVFIPASHTGIPRDGDLNVLLKTPVKFVIIDVDRFKGHKRAVGSIRKANAVSRKDAVKKFWEEAKVGDIMTGTVRSIASFGVFVNLGGPDGLIHITEASWDRSKKLSELFTPGQKVKVLIKDLDPERKRISLTAKLPENDPFTKFCEQYKVGDVAECTVTSLVDFGAFARIVPGVEGLIHISNISETRIDKPSSVLAKGQKVTVKIIDINPSSKKVSLSMRAVLEEEAAAAEEPAETSEAAEEKPAESTEE